MYMLHTCIYIYIYVYVCNIPPSLRGTRKGCGTWPRLNYTSTSADDSTTCKYDYVSLSLSIYIYIYIHIYTYTHIYT